MATNASLDDSPAQRKLCSIKKGSKLYYYTLTSSDIQNTAVSKWQYDFHSDLSWYIIYLKPFITTQETKLRWFQYRILHRMLTTNSFAYKLKLLDSEACTFCHIIKNLLYINFVNVKLSNNSGMRF